jgi:hypothetical protein
MELKFGRVSWDDLQVIRDAIDGGALRFDGVKDMQRKFLAGLAKAVDMEIRRKEMAGEQLHGSVILSIDLKIEPERRLDSGFFGKRISLQELDELANERQRRAIEEEARLKKLEELRNAGTPSKDDLGCQRIPCV